MESKLVFIARNARFQRITALAGLLGASALLAACSGSSSSGTTTPVAPATPTPSPVVSTPTPTPDPVASNSLIKLNQLGFMPAQQKLAVVPNNGALRFDVVSASNNTVVMSGDLSSAESWSSSGETVRRADFSSLSDIGSYRIVVEGLDDSPEFEIAEDVYDELAKESLKAYYRARSGTETTAAFAGDFAHPLSHPDTNVLVHASAATDQRPVNTAISSPGGWYDAGDYGKYIVNSGITVYSLMLAYEQFPELFDAMNVGIPESGNTVPDILDELRWNLDWMQSMQDLDGGVYHKLTALRFSAMSTAPERDTSQRYVISKSVTASLNVAASLAFASRVYEDIDATLAASYLDSAERAWSWAVANPTAYFRGNPSGVGTGPYDDTDASDEFAWAAIELFLATGTQAYADAYTSRFSSLNKFETPGWRGVDSLALMSATAFGKDVLSTTDYMNARQALLDAASAIRNRVTTAPYRAPIWDGLFYWGSNSNVAYNGMILNQAYLETENAAYLNATASALDYLLGRNATDYSFVTGFGDRSPQDIHHRPSLADNIDAPYPGLLVGGPHTRNRENGCSYPFDEPARAYVDHNCSYSTNEIAINWNAPLVYLSAAVIEGFKP